MVQDRKANPSPWVSKKAEERYAGWVALLTNYNKAVDTACQGLSETASTWCKNEQGAEANGDTRRAHQH